MFFSNRATSKCLKLIIIVSSLALINGNPITRKQFSKVNKLIDLKVVEMFPSDDSDKYSDLLYQEQYDKGNLTYYHAGDKKLPVFVSFGMSNVGKNVHVLQRGEDYIDPNDRNTFIVLKKSDKDNLYNVHRAYVSNMDNIDGSNVFWGDVMVEQKTNAKPLLEQMGNKEVQARSMRSSRPLCDWIGLLLICDSKKNIPPVRERIPYEFDADGEEYEDAPTPLGGASGSAEGGEESKVVRKREKPYKVHSKARAFPSAPKPSKENEHVADDKNTKNVAVAEEIHDETPHEEHHESQEVTPATSPLPEKTHNEEASPPPEKTPDVEQKHKRKHKKKHGNKKRKNNM